MSAASSFERFWNGSEPGWVVLRHIHNLVCTTILFGPEGPSVTEVQALRKCFEFYRGAPAIEVLRALKGQRNVEAGSHASAEARRFASLLKAEGLQFQQTGKQEVHDLMFNETTKMAALIEDSSLSRQVVETAISKGVPIRHAEN